MNGQVTPRNVNKSEKKPVNFELKGRQNTDDLDVDPDLQTDVYIQLPHDAQASARTRNTLSSGKSRKSIQSHRSKKSDAADENIVRSRGRPIKPHETEPFLSIDNLPPEKSFISERSVTTTTGAPPRPSTNKNTPRANSRSPTLVRQMQRMSVYMSPYSQPPPGPPSPSIATSKAARSSQPTGSKSRPSTVSRPITPSEGGSPNIGLKLSRPSSVSASQVDTGLRPGTGSRAGTRAGTGTSGAKPRSSNSRNGRITPANTPYHSPNKQLRAPNHHIKSPFKHSVSKPEMELDGRQTPSQGLKERTSLAAYHINKVLMVAREKDAHQMHGKLKKGKLKPLYPVNVNGPRIQQCRGIISETKSYGASPSRTLQRHLHLMNTIPNVHEYLYDRPRTVESVHQTSIASSMDENADNDIDDDVYLDSNRSLPDEILYTSQKSSSMMTPVVPENTFIPLQTQEETQEAVPASSVEATPRMFATEISSRDQEMTKGEVSVSNQLLHELYIGDAKEIQTETDKIEVNKSTNSNNNNSSSNNSGYNDPSDEERAARESAGGSRPARIGSPSKSVRFAVDKSKMAESQNSKEIKQITNTNIAKQQRESQGSAGSDKKSNKDENEANDGGEDESVSRKNKQNAKSSCRDEDIDTIYKKDDDDEDKKRDENRKKERNNSANSSSGRVNSGKGKGDNSVLGKSSSNSNSSNGSQNHSVGNQSTNMRPRSASLTRSNRNNSNRTNIRSQTPTKKCRSSSSVGAPTATRGNNSSRVDGTKSRPNSAGGLQTPTTRGSHCSRFEKSQASKSHVNKLQVSSVLHGDSVKTILCPESPTRSRSRSASPCRRPNSQSYGMSDESSLVPYFEERNETSNEAEFKFFSTNSQPCFEEEFNYDNYSQRSKVRFMLEGEAPPMDTIFLEDDDFIGLKQDKDITFEALDSEIAALRLNIQNKVLHGFEEKVVKGFEVNDSKVNDSVVNDSVVNANDEYKNLDYSEEDSSADNQSVTMEIDEMDSVREDYSNLLDKYRQRCMDRSESYGAMSATLVTPRDANSVASTMCRLQEIHEKRSFLNAIDSEYRSDNPDPKYQLADNQNLNGTVLSDSGRGSVDNLSEFSKNSSNVPKLDLDGSTSDLGLDTGRSDVTVINNEEEGGENKGDKNLLEMMCDHLSPFEQQTNTPETKKETEEDVTKLKVVATTKSLSKPKQQRLPSSSTRAPFPPLCFTINARAPKGFLYYFAYGPDMNPNRFSNYIQRDIDDRYWALLFGFSLIFNKRGMSEEAGGFANLEFNPLRSVEGCLYKITPEELQILDKCVGYPQHYEHLVLPVWFSNSKDPGNMGVAQYCVPALTYIAQNNWTETEKQLPCDYALSQCIKSADMVTTEYKESLITMATQQEVQVSA